MGTGWHWALPQFQRSAHICTLGKRNGSKSRTGRTRRTRRSLIMAGKSSFVDKVLGRIGRLDAQGLQTVVERLARERLFLETLFNTIEDGVLVVDEAGRILYFNQAVSRFLGLQPHVEGEPITNFIPELDWEKIAR